MRRMYSAVSMLYSRRTALHLHFFLRFLWGTIFHLIAITVYFLLCISGIVCVVCSSRFCVHTVIFDKLYPNKSHLWLIPDFYPFGCLYCFYLYVFRIFLFFLFFVLKIYYDDAFCVCYDVNVKVSATPHGFLRPPVTFVLTSSSISMSLELLAFFCQ